MENGFGMSKKPGFLETNYSGKWIIARLNGVPITYAGMFKGVKEGYIFLNPHQSGRITKEGKLVLGLIDSPQALNLGALVSIEETTIESIENYNHFKNIEEQNPDGSSKKSKE